MSRPPARRIGRNPIVATDADLAGQVAAERDFWMLTPHRLDPGYAQFPEGSDPADLLAQRGPAALTAALDRGTAARRTSSSTNGSPTCHPNRPSSRQHGSSPPGPPHAGMKGSSTISSRLDVPLHAVRQTLLAQVKDWNTDPRRAAASSCRASTTSRDGCTGAAQIPPEQRWAALADQLDQRLLRQGDWPALAQLIQTGA